MLLALYEFRTIPSEIFRGFLVKLYSFVPTSTVYVRLIRLHKRRKLGFRDCDDTNYPFHASMQKQHIFHKDLSLQFKNLYVRT